MITLPTEERWKRLESNKIKNVTEIMGFCMLPHAQEPWIARELLLDTEERKKWKHQSTEEAKQEYRRINNRLQITTIEAREKWWETYKHYNSF